MHLEIFRILTISSDFLQNELPAFYDRHELPHGHPKYGCFYWTLNSVIIYIIYLYCILNYKWLTLILRFHHTYHCVNLQYTVNVNERKFRRSVRKFATPPSSIMRVFIATPLTCSRLSRNPPPPPFTSCIHRRHYASLLPLVPDLFKYHLNNFPHPLSHIPSIRVYTGGSRADFSFAAQSHLDQEGAIKDNTMPTHMYLKC